MVRHGTHCRSWHTFLDRLQNHMDDSTGTATDELLRLESARLPSDGMYFTSFPKDSGNGEAPSSSQSVRAKSTQFFEFRSYLQDDVEDHDLK